MLNQQNYYDLHHQSATSTVYVVQTTPKHEKIICKDDNLKKMLALPENDLIIENTSTNLSSNSQHQQQTKSVEKFFQLDGTVDEKEQDSVATTSTSSSKLSSTKVVINHELLSSYGITLTSVQPEQSTTMPTTTSSASSEQKNKKTLTNQQQIQSSGSSSHNNNNKPTFAQVIMLKQNKKS